MKKENKLLNLNFKVYSEFIHTYKITSEDHHKELCRFASTMNAVATMDKKIWLEMIKNLNIEQKNHSEILEKIRIVGEHV